MNSPAIAAALRALADAIETPAATQDLPAAPVAAPAPRGRGRPRADAAPAAAVPTPPVAPVTPAAAPSSVEADPFSATQPVVAPPVGTLDDVRKALTALREATTQANALAVLEKASGVNNLAALKQELYGTVVAAARAAMPAAVAAPVVEESDPFSIGAAAPAEKALSIEDVKHVIVETQKRTSSATVQKLVMDHGGKQPDATSPTGFGPSLQALPVEQYATVVAALKALPSTK